MVAPRCFCAALVALVGCSADAGTVALWTAHVTEADYYALPYPNNLHRTAAGTLDLADFPRTTPVVEQYIAEAEKLDGFGVSSPMFVRFSDDIDPATLPSPQQSTAVDAAVQVVDIDPASPNYGRLVPIVATFRSVAGDTIGPHSLAVRPYPGFALQEGTTYALIVTDAVLDGQGAPLQPAADFAALRDGHADEALAAAQAVYAPLWAWLDSGKTSLQRAHVVDAAVFTTQHVFAPVRGVRAAVAALPAPTIRDVVSVSSNGLFSLYDGVYDAPNFQQGTVPYRNSGGEILLDAAGVAKAARTEALRVAVSFPLGPVPATGFPLVVYQHGTGGSYHSLLDIADWFASAGIAVIGIDQVLHGPRNPGGNPDIDVYNYPNPQAARDNIVQGYADGFSLVRAAQSLAIVDGARTLRIDPNRIMLFGHSQGGDTGTGFAAFEPRIRTAVFSGTGGNLSIEMLHRIDPVGFADLIALALRDQPFDEDNPTLGLAQMLLERVDPGNYAPLLTRTPARGMDDVVLPLRNVLLIEGLNDTYVPNAASEAFATALGADIVRTPDSTAMPGVTLRGRMTIDAPVHSNLGMVTAAVAQYAPAAGANGHFVLFHSVAAQRQALGFFSSAAMTGQATIPP